MHYFQGDEATAREAIDCGFHISLARPLTRLPELQEVARVIPLENIVLETDAFPQPFKKYPPQLDRAPPCARSGPAAGRLERYQRCRGRRGHHAQSGGTAGA